VTETVDLQEYAGHVRDVRGRFVALTEPHRPELWQYCLRLTGSAWDAEDLVQETMLRAFARLGNLWQPIRDGRAYLFRIASNAWIDAVRRARTAREADDAVPDDVTDEAAALGPEARVAAGQALARLVGLLPPRQRVVLLLADVFEFRNREIGAMIGVTEGAAKALLHRARATLRDHAAAAAGAAAPAAAAPAGPTPAEREVVAAFVDAFNRRDVDALVALLDAGASTDIVGVAEEFGRDVIREQSLTEGMASPIPQRAEPVVVSGRPVIAVYRMRPDGPRALMWLIRLDIDGRRVCRWTSWFYTPELIRHAAAELGVPAAPAGYRYAGPDADGSGG
jgi:RNA polymerase sigma factor (sigma-70 family)